jgi:hypothetical protein
MTTSSTPSAHNPGLPGILALLDPVRSRWIRQYLGVSPGAVRLAGNQCVVGPPIVGAVGSYGAAVARRGARYRVKHCNWVRPCNCVCRAWDLQRLAPAAVLPGDGKGLRVLPVPVAAGGAAVTRRGARQRLNLGVSAVGVEPDRAGNWCLDPIISKLIMLRVRAGGA